MFLFRFVQMHRNRRTQDRCDTAVNKRQICDWSELEQSPHRKRVCPTIALLLFTKHVTMPSYHGKMLDLMWFSPICILYFWTFWVLPAMLHPQCLDFKPPFRPLRELELCIMYKEFGCCDYQKDQELMTKYYHIIDSFDYNGYINCAGFVLELLCQVSMHGQRLFGFIRNISN